MREVKKWRSGRSFGGRTVQMGGLRNGSFRFTILAIFIVLVVGLDVDVAYAANNLSRYDGVVYGPDYIVTSLVTSDYNSRQWVIVNAPDKFSAAVYAVGGNPSELDSDKKALLSNASTGGDFYTFSGLFTNLGGSFDIPDWMGGAEKTIYRTFENLYGEDNLFVAAFTPAQKYGAASDYGVIVDGGNLGGGSGGTVESDNYVLIPVNDWAPNNGTGALDVTHVAVPKAAYTQLKTFADEHGYSILARVGRGNKNGSSGNQTLVVVVKKSDILFHDYYNGRSYVIQYVVSSRYPSYYLSDFSYTTSNVLEIDGYKCAPANSRVSSFTVASAEDGFYPVYKYGWDDDVVTPSVPDTNWPDDDSVLPTPPDLPEPQSPIIDEQPTSPTPDPSPSYPTYTVVSVNNFTADIQGILDAMDEHCGHLQEALWWNFNNFWQRLSTKMTNDFSTLRTFLSQQFSWIVNSVDSMFDSLKDYLEDLAEWLRDELNYIIGDSAYDDNTLLSWLRRIYYKLGNGSASTKPVDPNANPDGVGDWISQLFANLFTALDDLAGGLLTSLATLIGGLATKFPFSIPWDVAAILGLLVAEPVAPSLEFPVYTLSGGDLVQVGTMNIDMDAWTPYLTGIHMMIRVSFILFLMLKTKDFMTIMEKAVGLDA